MKMNISDKIIEAGNENDWFLIEKISGSSPVLLAGNFRRMTDWFNKEFGIPIKMNLLYKNNSLYLYFLHKQFKLASEVLFDKSINDLEFLESIDKKNKNIQNKFFDYCNELDKLNFSDFSDDELIEKYEEYCLFLEKAIVAGWVDNVLEFENELFSSYLRNYIDKKIKENNLEYNPAEIFSILTTPDKKTYGSKQEEALDKIAVKIRKNKEVFELFNNNTSEIISEELKKLDQKIDNELTNHVNDYCWYFFMYEGPGWDRINFISSLKNILKEDSKKEKKVDSINKKDLINKLSIDEKHQKLLHQAAEMVFNKDLRKHSIYYASYVSLKLFEELFGRMNLSLRKVRTILPWEMRQLYNSNNLKQEIEGREDGFLMKFFKGKTEIIKGKKAIDFYNTVEENEKDDEDILEIKGSCAFPGFVKGIAKIVNDISEIDKIESGDILVAHQTDPDILPAMKLAAAFVTDLGGITCHAAIVSREMKKPCVVGTKIGSKVIKDGDEIEVNADNGEVKISKKSN